MKGKGSDVSVLDGFISSLRLGDAEKYENLTIFPLYSEISRENGYKTLDEAVTTEKFKVTEVSEGGSVPELKVLNELDSDVLIVDGEELAGAKQNRIINTTVIIGRHKEVVIPVSCVEQGRWSYRSRTFRAGKSNLYASLRKKKAKRVFYSLRHSSTFQANQSEIWEDISEKSARFSVNSDTGAMDEIFNQCDSRIKEYEKKLEPHPGQAGFVAVINGKIIGFDVFGSKDVLPRLYNKLLKGYVIDAIDKNDPEKKEPSKENPQSTEEMVMKFLAGVKKIKKEAFTSVGEGDDLRFESKHLNGFALVHNSNVIHMAAFAE